MTLVTGIEEIGLAMRAQPARHTVTEFPSTCHYQTLVHVLVEDSVNVLAKADRVSIMSTTMR